MGAGFISPEHRSSEDNHEMLWSLYDSWKNKSAHCLKKTQWNLTKLNWIKTFILRNPGQWSIDREHRAKTDFLPLFPSDFASKGLLCACFFPGRFFRARSSVFWFSLLVESIVVTHRQTRVTRDERKRQDLDPVAVQKSNPRLQTTTSPATSLQAKSTPPNTPIKSNSGIFKTPAILRQQGYVYILHLSMGRWYHLNTVYM